MAARREWFYPGLLHDFVFLPGNPPAVNVQTFRVYFFHETLLNYESNYAGPSSA